MKVLSFGHIPTWAGGRQESGLANVIYQLAKNMADCDGVEMSMAATDVFIPLKQDGKLAIYGWTKYMLIKYGLKHPFVSFKWFLSVLNAKLKFGAVISIPGFFFKGLHLVRTISIVKPDAIHLHGMTACVYDKIVPTAVKIVVTMHGIIGNDRSIPNQEYLSRMERLICHSKRYSLICFIADKLISDFKEIYGCINTSYKAILNAYDNKAFYYTEHVKQPKLTLATIASLRENKGQMRVLQAIAASRFDIKYICIGAGTDKLIAQNKKFAVEHQIDYEYVGKKTPTEIREILSKTDYMILPSSTEGFGIAYLEAIACGVPVVLPKYLPIVQQDGIIQPTRNSILLEDCSTEAIVKALSTLLNMNFNRKLVSESIINCSWIGIAKQYVESFKSI